MKPARPARRSVSQRGIALLTAIILVAVAAVIATAIAWQSQLAARRGIAVFTVAQSLAIAQGAEAMAAWALRTSHQNNPQVVSPNQDWAKPYGPVEMEAGAVLEASLEDQAGKFNLNSVVMQGLPGNPPNAGSATLVANPAGKTQFETLLASLNIDTEFAGRLIDWIDSDDQPTFPGGAEDSFYLAAQPPHRTLNMPLTSITELLAMGMDRASYERLAPFVTALPPNTPLNLCTAPGAVLDAVSGESLYARDPTLLLSQRQQNTCFPDKALFLSTVPAARQTGLNVGTTSRYFRLRSWITIGTTRFTLYSLIEQDGSGRSRPIFRTFGTE